MNKANVAQIVKDYAKQNFDAYPEDYPTDDGLATDGASEAAQDLGVKYWEHRTIKEMQRDEELDVSKIDYVEWVMQAFSDWLEVQ